MDKDGLLKKRIKKFFRKKEAKEEKEKKAEGGGSKDSAPSHQKKSPVVPPKPQKTKVPAAGKKYENVEKVKRIEDEEREEFEVVQNARPAVCRNKRKAKLQWKQEEEHKSEADFEKADPAEKADEATPPSSHLGDPVIDPLKDALADLTVEKRQLKETIARLKMKLKKKDRRMAELEFAVKEKEELFQRDADNPMETGESSFAQMKRELEMARETIRKQNEKAMVDAEELKKLKAELAKIMMPKEEVTQEGTEETEAKKPSKEEASQLVAVKVLKVMSRNQLLDDALDFKETQELHAFFTTNTHSQPSERILMLLEKAITIGINKLIKNAHEVNDVIDNAMRQFLLKSPTAKTVLLDTMLCRLEYLPAAWGGKMMALASQRAIRKLKNRRNAVRAKKTSGEREKEKSDKRKLPKEKSEKSQYFI